MSGVASGTSAPGGPGGDRRNDGADWDHFISTLSDTDESEEEVESSQVHKGQYEVWPTTLTPSGFVIRPLLTAATKRRRRKKFLFGRRRILGRKKWTRLPCSLPECSRSPSPTPDVSCLPPPPPEPQRISSDSSSDSDTMEVDQRDAPYVPGQDEPDVGSEEESSSGASASDEGNTWK